jgi:hypothetical protein
MQLASLVLAGPRTRMPLVLLAVAALAAGSLTLGAKSASAAGDATVAKKKKCAPGFTRTRVSKKNKKKKCRPAPGPRATLTWNNGTGTPTDLDLSVWDAFGNRNGGIAAGGIPAATGPDDNQAFGPEIFADLRKPATRNFTIGVCMSNDNGTDDTVATLVFRPPNGSTQTVTSASGALADDGSFALLYLGDFNPGLAPGCL